MAKKKKIAALAGADEKTPSHAEYFSWVNHTNDGADERQTLINLDYFAYLRRTYGMQLDIYAWDAGNLDGSKGLYGSEVARKKQYPTGYGNCAAAARKLGIRLGVWCGPDGFGDTKEEEDARMEQMVSLCRDYGFGLFKIDGVCGGLREEKQETFVRMMKECRRYVPDLVLLNHRLPLGIGEPYATTFLWDGVETYVDVHICNLCTAPNHRGFVFDRGVVLCDGEPEMQRLAEDHGVCLSSCMEGFEDDLIYQAFSRDLILAPEIYANPWLLTDEEQGHLAYLFNLHRRLNAILPDGMILDEARFGRYAVARGTGTHRCLVFGNPTWNEKTVDIPLNGEIGLTAGKTISVISHHPYIRVLGTFAYGDTVSVTVPPFYAALYEICESSEAPDLPENCTYLVLHEDETGRPDRIKVLPEREPPLPVLLGTTAPCAVPGNAEQLLETALFAADNDSLEAQSQKRAGKTEIPEVQAARDAFFGQETYRMRGVESAYAFDDRDDTFFDGNSRYEFKTLRIDGGCMRLDLGKTVSADTVEIEYFDTAEERPEAIPQVLPIVLETSFDLAEWRTSGEMTVTVLNDAEDMPYVRMSIHDIKHVTGSRCVASYPVSGSFRYLRMPEPPDRIYRISVLKNGRRIALESPRVNNLMPPPGLHPVIETQSAEIMITADMVTEAAYLAVGIEGVHGIEGAYAVITDETGKRYGAPDRAPAYPANIWECIVRCTHHHYTYYFPVTESMAGHTLTVWILQNEAEHEPYHADIRLCRHRHEPEGEIITR